MELLVDLIIAIIKAATSDSKQPKLPSIPFDEERRRALAAQMQAIQQQVIGAPARVPNSAVRLGAVRKQQRGPAKPPPLPMPASSRSSPLPAVPALAVQSRRGNARVPLRIPLIMGEILGPPLALREPEF
jgi:hypothetical protein